MVKYQPSDMDRTFSALADPTRRHVLLRLKDEKKTEISVARDRIRDVKERLGI